MWSKLTAALSCHYRSAHEAGAQIDALKNEVCNLLGGRVYGAGSSFRALLPPPIGQEEWRRYLLALQALLAPLQPGHAQSKHVEYPDTFPDLLKFCGICKETLDAFENGQLQSARSGVPELQGMNFVIQLVMSIYAECQAPGLAFHDGDEALRPSGEPPDPFEFTYEADVMPVDMH